MTEQEWLAAIHPDSLLPFVDNAASERKMRLFACACCWRIAHCLRFADFARTIEATESYVDRQITWEEFQQAFKVIDDHVLSQTPEHGVSCWGEYPVLWASATWYRDGYFPADAAQRCAEGAREAMERRDPDHQIRLEAGPTEPVFPYPFTDEQLAEFSKAANTRYTFVECERQQLRDREARLQAIFLYDIFGNPFRPVALDPAWVTSDVRALATGIYADRAFDRMPILADALQDAGCANEDVLAHCRTDVAHVRGCWVVDLLLGKG